MLEMHGLQQAIELQRTQAQLWESCTKIPEQQET